MDRREVVASSAAFDEIATDIVDRGSARVLVGLQTAFRPEGALDLTAQIEQRLSIQLARDQLVTALAGTDFEVLRTYTHVPYIALRLSESALDALAVTGKAASVRADRPESVTLDDSTAIVEADEAAALGRSGSGQHVAILDTGVEKTHAFLQQASGTASKVVSEACFSTTANCPNGATTDISAGSAVPCTYAPNACGHGTHVAGIAAGRGSAFSGVARSARLIAIQVFSRATGQDCAKAGEDPCAVSYPSDQMAGLDHILDLRTQFTVAAVNMSLGGGVHTVNCDDDERKASIDNLLSVGIATVIASGNNSSNSGVSAPACISSAITVGSTTNRDVVARSSNSSAMVDLLAPGVDINSSLPGGLYGVRSGTSMAAPHVAGAFATMRGTSRSAAVATILSHLQETGKPITDSDNGLVRPRVRILSASVLLSDTGFKDGYSHTFPGGDVASNGIGLATRASSAARGKIAIRGVPAGAVVERAYLYWMTIGGPDDTVVFDGEMTNGGVVGASRDSCWDVNQLGPNRVYRAVLPTSGLAGNGRYSVRGVGGPDGSDGQGASLVLIYSRPDSSSTGTILLRHGALTVDEPGETMSQTFDELVVPSAPTQVNLHVGMGDGQYYSESALSFSGTPVTGDDFFYGADGEMWDDARIPVPPSLLPQIPPGVTSHSTSVTGDGDCLAWAYAGLAYQYETP